MDSPVQHGSPVYKFEEGDVGLVGVYVGGVKKIVTFDMAVRKWVQAVSGMEGVLEVRGWGDGEVVREGKGL